MMYVSNGAISINLSKTVLFTEFHIFHTWSLLAWFKTLFVVLEKLETHLLVISTIYQCLVKRTISLASPYLPSWRSNADVP